MKAYPDTLLIFLSASVFLILLLAVLVFLPRLIRKKDSTRERITETDSVIGAFHALGNEIQSLKEQLIVRERLAAIGEVSAGIAHEFRNPMGVIAGYAKLLSKSFEDSDSRKEIARGILKEIEEMNIVMEDLLQFSKPGLLKKTDINLTGTITDMLKGFGDEAACNIDFSSGDSIVIKADETLLKQALKNLIRNALDAGDPALKTVWINIERGSSSGKEGVFIFIKDNGRGIAESDINKIFMPFYTTKERGAGIGLALVQKIAMGHGGNVSVESREGEGSTFRLFLPND
ncbi:MAG: ATP-binding protein [Nitrospirae bacterium]|nr:ATP-binding protein [Nitrospirota bacterium]MCL5977849.1 ATP-binding protein [Nitrospirota bacterium]